MKRSNKACRCPIISRHFKTFTHFSNTSDEHQIVCQTEPLTDDSKIDQSQTVSVFWVTGNISDAVTNFTFTYKPDPEIFSVYPNVTILK